MISRGPTNHQKALCAPLPFLCSIATAIPSFRPAKTGAPRAQTPSRMAAWENTKPIGGLAPGTGDTVYGTAHDVFREGFNPSYNAGTRCGTWPPRPASLDGSDGTGTGLPADRAASIQATMASCSSLKSLPLGVAESRASRQVGGGRNEALVFIAPEHGGRIARGGLTHFCGRHPCSRICRSSQSAAWPDTA